MSAPAGDEALLAAARGGDEQAFRTLAERHHRALRALAGRWPGGGYDAERDVAAGWVALVDAEARATPGDVPVRARAGRAVADAAVARTGAVPEPAPAQAIDWRRFFGSRHESWPGGWLGPPRPWGSIAQRRLAQSDVRRLLCRVVQELGVAQSAVVTLHDIHDWPMRECADALRRPADEARRLLRAGREGVRAALEAEVDCR